MNKSNDKLNIVYIGRFNPSENLSGPEKVAKRILTEHSIQNKTYFIQYFFDGRKYSIWKKLFGLDEMNIRENAVLYTAGILKIYRLLGEIKPDIIHIIAFERFPIIALLYKMINNVKIIYNEHGVIAYENSEIKKLSFWRRFKDKFCEKRFLDKSDKIIFVSETTIDIAEKYYKLDESKCVILANGVDKIFRTKNIKNFNSAVKAVLICNNELHKSGLDFLISYLKGNQPEIEINIISPLNPDIRGNVNTVKPMPADKLSEFYRDKHIFLSLNSYDTFSIAAAEAMAAGLVPIMTHETGISRYIENGFNGFTIPYGNTALLDTAVNGYKMLPPEAKKNLSQNAANIYESLNWKNIYGTYFNIYMGMLK